MLTVVTFDNQAPSKAYALTDVLDIEFTTAALGGFVDATITLGRQPGRAYLGIAYNYHTLILAPGGEVIFEGRIHALPQSIQNGGSSTYQITVSGYLINLNEQDTWIPAYTTATDIATIMLAGISGYAPMLNASSATVPATGTSVLYKTDNTASIRAHLDTLIKYGSSGNQELLWQVWNNRTFYLTPRPLVTSPYYESSVRMVDSCDLGINGDAFMTRVTVKYKTDTGVTTYTKDATSIAGVNWQSRYATTFGSSNPSASSVNLVRAPGIVDLTNEGIITDAQAQQIATTVMTRYAQNGVQTTATHLIFRRPDAIRDYRSGAIYPLHKVRAGQWLMIRDLLGADSSLAPGQAGIFVIATKYTMSTRSLEITGEYGQNIEHLLSRLLSSTKAYVNLTNAVG
ncbi:MAG: hypothetical protein HXX08_11430 [Chloroflexi bacterium]|uniref:Uncharacterized protein n=1 Tax=Candidatus Chlorohelix allophototropha TaxID=3003348 RepID=A0A8T7M2T9_9CHLR|nr:hypothetical protein [Chloroflexota bacterium]WJW65849.1 hypothetical protein OZ401_001628 [Chloroflexota bacterium L227-S17]